jgi:hypothetical protein
LNVPPKSPMRLKNSPNFFVKPLQNLPFCPISVSA